MADRNLGAEIINGINEIKQFKESRLGQRTLQDWEQGRRDLQGPAIALLRIAEQHPEVFTKLQ